MAPAQSFVSSYPPRLRQFANTLLQPVVPTQNVGTTGRTTKRGTTIINYADDAYDDDDFEDSEGPRRPTGLRSLRREEIEKKESLHERLGKEIDAPVDLQAIYRDWMIRKSIKPAYVDRKVPLSFSILTLAAELINKRIFKRNSHLHLFLFALISMWHRISQTRHSLYRHGEWKELQTCHYQCIRGQNWHRLTKFVISFCGICMRV